MSVSECQCHDGASQDAGSASQDGEDEGHRDAGSDTSYIPKVCQIIYRTEVPAFLSAAFDELTRDIESTRVEN